MMRLFTYIVFLLLAVNAYAQPETKLTASNGDGGDLLGGAVAVSGNYAIAGAPEDEPRGAKSGSVYFYELVNGAWVEKQNITPTDVDADDQFGFSVSIDGEWAAVGARYYGPSATQTNGKVYIYKRDASGIWSQFASFSATALDQFGSSVSLNGSYLAVGGVNGDANINGTIKQCGIVKIYRYNGSIWTTQATLVPDDGDNYDEFGCSVSLAGNQVVVGSRMDDDSGDKSGSAYVYSRVGVTWTQDAKLTASDGAASDEFGHSVALDADDNIIIGSHRDNGNKGAAYFYKKSGNAWTFVNKVTATDGATGEYFGESVSFVKPNGAVISAQKHKHAGKRSGAAYLFEYDSSSNQWIPNTITAEILPSDGANYDFFGHSVAGDGDWVFAGAYRDDDRGSNSGSVYAYDVSQIVLPVELTEFAAEAVNNNRIDLTWKTALERNNQGFFVQRSDNGFIWQTLGFVEGAGNSNQEITYRFVDDSPKPGVNYYRLRQIDFDGIESFSPIVSERIKQNTNFSVYPNPTRDLINIRLENGNEVQNATIYDLTGKKLLFFASTGQELDLSSLPAGTYVLTVTTQSATFSRLIRKE